MSAQEYISIEDNAFTTREFTALWSIAFAAYGIGGTWSTMVLLRLDGFARSTSLTQFISPEVGILSVVGIKLLTFGVALVVSVSAARVSNKWGFYYPPAALAIVGSFTTVMNLILLLG